MQPNKVYDEVIEFIASSSPQNVIAFRPSEEAKAHVADLIFREKTEGLHQSAKSRSAFLVSMIVHAFMNARK